MTKIELALILKIIDSHTITHTYNYGAPDTANIDDVGELRADIIRHYEEIMKDS